RRALLCGESGAPWLLGPSAESDQASIDDSVGNSTRGMRDWWRLQEFILPRRLIECLEQIGADCGCVPMVKQTGEEQWKQVGPIKVPHEIVLLGVDRGRNTFRKRFPHEVEGAPVLFVMPRVNDDEF